MQFEMTVCEVKLVDIPDIPSTIMEFVQKNKGCVCLYSSVDRYESTQTNFAGLYVNIEGSDELEDDEADTFPDRLSEIPGYQESMLGDVPWFQSDMGDGFEPCEQFIRQTKAQYPEVLFV